MLHHPPKNPSSAYAFTFHRLGHGEALPLSVFKGKVLLVVNTASRCGFTPQYQQLEALAQAYHAQGLVVIGTPSNDFGKQERGQAKDIQQFCQKNYGVTFPLTQKIHVKGPHAHPFYVWAQQVTGVAVLWNFHKYLIDRQGRLVDYFFPFTSPLADRLVKKIKFHLAKNE